MKIIFKRQAPRSKFQQCLHNINSRDRLTHICMFACILFDRTNRYWILRPAPKVDAKINLAEDTSAGNHRQTIAHWNVKTGDTKLWVMSRRRVVMAAPLHLYARGQSETHCNNRGHSTPDIPDKGHISTAETHSSYTKVWPV